LQAVYNRDMETMSPNIEQLRPKNQEALADVLNVGGDKPLGYLSTRQIETAGYTVPEVNDAVELRGMSSRFVSEEEGANKGGSLYAYDPVSLAALLAERSSVLEHYEWPAEVDAFVEKVATQVVRPGNELYDLIADAFADYSNMLRTDIEKAA